MYCTDNFYGNDSETLFSVGRRFLTGDCVGKDLQKAKAMLTKAAEMGHPVARKLLDEIEQEHPTDNGLGEWNKMRSGQMYDWSDPVIDKSLKRSRLACEEFNKSGIDHENYRTLLADMIPGVPPGCTGNGCTSPCVVHLFQCDAQCADDAGDLPEEGLATEGRQGTAHDVS